MKVRAMMKKNSAYVNFIGVGKEEIAWQLPEGTQELMEHFLLESNHKIP